jgi:hypothetical protein
MSIPTEVIDELKAIGVGEVISDSDVLFTIAHISLRTVTFIQVSYVSFLRRQESRITDVRLH